MCIRDSLWLHIHQLSAGGEHDEHHAALVEEADAVRLGGDSGPDAGGGGTVYILSLIHILPGDEPAQASAHVQHSELRPQVHQPIGGGRAGQAHDALDAGPVSYTHLDVYKRQSSSSSTTTHSTSVTPMSMSTFSR